MREFPCLTHFKESHLKAMNTYCNLDISSVSNSRIHVFLMMTSSSNTKWM